jgi:hypothetical protein
MDRGTLALVAALVLANENQERQQACFVPWRPQKRLRLAPPDVLMAPRNHAQAWERDAQEAIALPVLAGPGLEKPPVGGRTPGARSPTEFGENRGG